MYIGTYFTSVFIQGCTVLQGMVLARMLGPEGRGQFAAILLWPSMFAALGLMGVNMALTRRAGAGEDPGLLSRSAIIISSITGITTVLVCYFCVPYLIPEQDRNLIPYISVFLLFIPLNQMALNLLAIDQGVGNFRLLNLSRAILYPVFFSGIIYVWFFAEDRLMGGILALLVGNGAVLIIRLRAKWHTLGKTSQFLPLKNLFREGALYQLTAVFTLASQYVDQILLLWILNPRQLGIYVVARSSSSIISSLSSSLGLISLTEATQLGKENGFLPLARMLRRGSLALFFLAIFFAPLFHVLIPVIYGSDFVSAIPFAVILLAGLVAAGLSDIIEQTLRGHGLPLAGFLARTAGGITLAIVGGVTATSLGVMGVVIGFVVANWVVLGIFLRVIYLNFDNANIKQIVPKFEDAIFIFYHLKQLIFRQKNI